MLSDGENSVNLCYQQCLSVVDIGSISSNSQKGASVFCQ